MLADNILNIPMSEAMKEAPVWVNLIPVLLIIILVLGAIKVSYKSRPFRKRKFNHNDQDDNY